MCIAIVKPAGAELAESTLRHCWQGNSDGGGFAFNRDGQVVIRKGYMKLQDFLAAYNEEAGKNPDSNFLVHFRIRTHGWKNEDNTHPFPIAGGALIHNGSLTGTGAEHGKGASDTALFAQKFGRYLTYDRVMDHKEEWEKAIGYNKIALLYDDGRYIKLNDKLWIESEGVSYSHGGYKPYTSYVRNYHARAADDGVDYTGMGGYAESWQGQRSMMH